MSLERTGPVVALAGGVGGARLVDGLDRVLPEDALDVVINTGDDFEHWGLHISPDVDTIMYTLAGLAPEERGWGIDGDTFHVLAEAARRGDESWFQLGDRDLVTHLSRTAALARGESLTSATERLCRSLGVTRRLLPMSDGPRPTKIRTRDGETLEFQEWLVRTRASLPVAAVDYAGSAEATSRVLDALERADLVVLCPSNPFVSIDPILSLGRVRDAVRRVPTIGVSPIIAGSAVKGPLATMIRELTGAEPSARAVAEHYGDLLDGFLVQDGDGFEAPYPVVETNILIRAREDRVRLASELVQLAREQR
jgi:LPPG:FO 2-phospho-L-lactate transferase